MTWTDLEPTRCKWIFRVRVKHDVVGVKCDCDMAKKRGWF